MRPNPPLRGYVSACTKRTRKAELPLPGPPSTRPPPHFYDKTPALRPSCFCDLPVPARRRPVRHGAKTKSHKLAIFLRFVINPFFRDFRTGLRVHGGK